LKKNEKKREKNMISRKKTKYRRLVVIALIIGICVTTIQIGAVSTTNSISEKRTSSDYFKRIVNEKYPASDTLTKERAIIKNIKPIVCSAGTSIIETELDCQNPAITANGNDILAIAEESQSIFESDLLITYSSDGGNTWSELFYDFATEDVREMKPVIDFCENNEFEAYGTCLPDVTGTVYFLHFPSMTDPTVAYKDTEGWTPWAITVDFYDYYGMDIAGYPHGENAPAIDFHGILTLIGDSSYGETIENYYETEGGSIGACYLAFEGQLGDSITCDIDVSTETYFEAMELRNDPDLELEDGVFFEYCWVEPGNEDWWENDWPGFIFEGAHNPDLSANGGNCYVVVELEGDIVCFYSDDNGETMQSSTVATNGQLPKISANGETAICTFIRNGDLYGAKSNDGGQTWEEYSEAINDNSGTVIEDESSVDVVGSYVVWTDNRNTIRNIFFSIVGAPPSKPLKPEGPTSGRVNSEQTYTTSATDLEGDQIYYIFDWGDDTTSEVGPYNSGATATASHTWTEQGDYSIRVKAKDATGLESSWSDPLAVSMPKVKHLTVHKLNLLFEKFVSLWPVISQLLSH
jgi:hypothetical protein